MSQRRPVPIHRLRKNETVWTPPSVIVLDTETRWHDQGPDEVHQLRCWVACRVDRRPIRGRAREPDWGWGDTRQALSDWIDRQAKGRDCLWLYAHNLGFDVAVTGLPLELARRGWAAKDFSVRNSAPWFRFGKGRATLTVCDSWTWLPESLDSVATRMGGHKVELPDNAADMGDWWKRCAGDVDLTLRALLSLMEWWDRERLGRWTISGAGSGYNAMRHRPSDERHVIDVEPAKVQQDRLAVRGGRKDAQIIRSADGGPWVELDLEAAYPTVALTLPLPVKRAWSFDHLDPDSRWLVSDHYSPLAEVTINTDRALYPVRYDGVTWYPVGRFRTVLAGPELREAAELGHVEAIGQGQMHRLGYALRNWAHWVLDPSQGGSVDTPPVAYKATKEWGRSVPGKFAARTHSSEVLRGAAPPGWAVTDMWDARTKRKGAIVDMAGSRRLVTFDLDTENCYPAVLAFIESHVRLRLSRVLEALGMAWWTCDTDGLLVDLYRPDLWVRSGVAPLGVHARDAIGVAQGLCDQLYPLVAPLRLRPKRTFDSLRVLGPQHLIAGDERRMAGVSKRADQVDTWQFRVRDWPGLRWQINHSTPGEYVRPERHIKFKYPTVHRWVDPDGRAWPVEFRISNDGNNEVVNWGNTRLRGQGVRLAALQYPRLERLVF